MKEMNTRLVLIGLLVCLSCVTGSADDFSARVSKFTTREALKVDNVWRTDIPHCLKVTLRSSKEILGIDAYFKAYFYDADGRLLRAQTGPNSLWTGTKKGTGEYTMPDAFKTGQLEPVYLALPDDLKKMKTVIVIFGQGDNLTCEVYPNNRKAEDFDFPEKDKVLKK